jgi:predicted nucleic acid-binding protein
MTSNPRTGLSDIPTGEFVAIDASIFPYSIRQKSVDCERFLVRCTRGELSGIVSTHILAEIMHQVMIAEARDCQWITGPNPAKKLAALPRRIQALTRYEGVVRDIIGIGIQVEPVVPEDSIAAMSIQREAGLLTNDALLAAACERLRITSIASADKAFERVRGIIAYLPGDIES